METRRSLRCPGSVSRFIAILSRTCLPGPRWQYVQKNLCSNSSLVSGKSNSQVVVCVAAVGTRALLSAVEPLTNRTCNHPHTEKTQVFIAARTRWPCTIPIRGCSL